MSYYSPYFYILIKTHYPPAVGLDSGWYSSPVGHPSLYCSLLVWQLEGSVEDTSHLQTLVIHLSTVEAVFSCPFVVAGEKWEMMLIILH